MTLGVIILLVAFGIADIVTTLIGLKRGDTEANKVAVWLMKQVGTVPALIIQKVLFTAITGLVAYHWPLVGGLFVLVYVYIIYNNVRVIRTS